MFDIHSSMQQQSENISENSNNTNYMVWCDQQYSVFHKRV